MQATIDELNSLARNGHIVAVGHVSFLGAHHFALADGSAEIRQINELPCGQGGAVFHWLSGWELIANGSVIARWVYGPRQTTEKNRAYQRTHRWLLLKAQKLAPN